MKRSRIIGISIVVLIMGVLLIVANLYIDYNLRKYSVYYAHNMEHKNGTHPEIAMGIENIEYIKIQRRKGIEYDSDGNIVTYNNNNEVCGDVPYVSKMPGYSGKARYCYHNAAENKTYYFDASFMLTEADDNKSGSAININEINYRKLHKQLIKDFGILIKANVNRKPRINLQKQFNKKYYKRFN